MTAAKLCRFCGQPMKPKGVKKRPNEYDHAQGCPYTRRKNQESLQGRQVRCIKEFRSIRYPHKNYGRVGEVYTVLKQHPPEGRPYYFALENVAPLSGGDVEWVNADRFRVLRKKKNDTHHGSAPMRG